MASLQPYLVVYLKQQGLSASESGVLFGSMPFLSFLVQPLVGAAADRWLKHKAVLVTATVLTGLFHLLFLAVPPRTPAGFCGAAAFIACFFGTNINVRCGNMLKNMGSLLVLPKVIAFSGVMSARMLAYSLLSNPWLVLVVEPLHGACFALGSLQPYLVVYLKQQGLSASESGVLFGSMPFLSFLVQPLVGAAADRWLKHKAVLVTATVLTGLFHLLFLAVPPRTPAGFCGAAAFIACFFGTNINVRCGNMLKNMGSLLVLPKVVAFLVVMFYFGVAYSGVFFLFWFLKDLVVYWSK
nr:hypothetical protein BaRGS_021040 [Batillaria attramentaria]